MTTPSDQIAVKLDEMRAIKLQVEAKQAEIAVLQAQQNSKADEITTLLGVLQPAPGSVIRFQIGSNTVYARRKSLAQGGGWDTLPDQGGPFTWGQLITAAPRLAAGQWTEL